MPIYEYLCPKCELKFELLRPLSQSTEAAPCPRCHQGAKRVLSSFACFSASKDGTASAIGGSPCGSCGAASCDSCGV